MQHCAIYVIVYNNLTLLQNVVETYVSGILFCSARRVEYCGTIGSQNGGHMSEIKHFLERKRDGSVGWLLGREGARLWLAR